ncbi:unnamed protein product [Owenia fusiformis]|uniref:Uncharacterized protein n=1 Tax=Owenia fusiformis TaxID=6347 RepID=A0A8J1U5D2_OWEFU|nr:unnamed protein product [Owenia fusiformis]
MSSELEIVSQQLVAAVEAVMNPISPQDVRLEAHKFIEEFKDTSPHCAPCSLLLADKSRAPVIRHIGLQLLEHCIKFKWNSLSNEDKLAIKDNAMQLIATGTHNILVEEAHIKDVLSRIMVEMIKREWPQQWPTLLQELDKLSQMGDTQKELVLLVLLRLAEDVVTFQNLQGQRRREIHQTLTSSMQEFYTFFIGILQSSVKSYMDLKSNGGATEEWKSHCKVGHAALNTLTGYVEWISMTYIMENGGLLLQLLCLLLNDEFLHLPAAECLLLIVSRKGKVEERQPLLILFSEDAMETILKAVTNAASRPLNEHFYLFLKRLCQVLTSLGMQLCALWGKENTEQPVCFAKFLESMLKFSQHDSQMLGSYTYPMWLSFLRHEQMKMDPLFLSYIPRLVQTCSQDLRKIGYPSLENSPRCAYSRLDFDSDEDFNSFFSRCRAEIAEVVRAATMLMPGDTFNYGAKMLQELLTSQQLDVGEGSESGHCNLKSPSYIQWDAVSIYLESVMSRLMQTEGQPPVQVGINLLQATLQYQTEDPLILSCLLSCVSALFAYIKEAPTVLPQVLDKIFHAAVFNIGSQTKATRSRGVKNVRRHACSILVKICKGYPHLLLPAFEQLYAHVKKISSDPEQLSQMEKCTLMEAMILISNEIKSFTKQSAFIAEILTPVREMWLSDVLTHAFSSPEKFMTYIGLDQAPVEPSSADICGINRSQISYCVNTILAVLKRSKGPVDMETAVQGGFVSQPVADGPQFMNNPVTPHIKQFLQNLFALLKIQNCLWAPAYLAKRHPEFSRAFELQDFEKQAILGIQPPCVDNTEMANCKNPLERMQNFIVNTHDNCYHVLGNAGQCLGYQFYMTPELVPMLLASVFTNLDHIPDYRLRPIIRQFMKPYIYHCPAVCHRNAVMPLLSVICPYMLQRLNDRWAVMSDQMERGVLEDANPESKEVLDDMLTRQLTREYIDLIATICHSRRKDASSDDNTMESSETLVESQPSQHGTGTQKDDSLSELGQLALQDEAICSSMVLCAFNALNWNDTTTCNRSINICWPILKQLVHNQQVSSEAACRLFAMILIGLQTHGQHEGNQATLIALGLQAYELLLPVFPGVSEVLLKVPNTTDAKIKDFNNKLTNVTPQKPVNEKRKKDAFRKLVDNIIGKNIGQQFKHDVCIRNLPPLLRKKKPQPDGVLDTEHSAEATGLCSLFSQTNGT